MRASRSEIRSRTVDHLRWRHRRAKKTASTAATRWLRRFAPLSAFTFPLGDYGRLGNQLFQIAGTIGIAGRMNARAVFPRQWGYRKYFSLADELFADRITTARCDQAWPLAIGIDSTARVYLQDLGLWGAGLEATRRLLQPSAFAQEATARRCAELLALPSKTALHIRRGDYLTDGSHRPCPPSYYEQAVELIRAEDPSTQLLVFSDEIDWCRRNLALPDAHYVGGNPDWVDLTFMSHCEHHICANSTFSWWGAFLSRNPNPIVPWLIGVTWPLRMQHPPGWREIEIAP
jgi:glycosyl transferase family 11